MAEAWKQPFELGVKALCKSNYGEAIKYFTRSIEFDDTNASVFELRAAAFQCISIFREALADSRKCIALQPDWYKGYYRAARIFFDLSERDKCIRFLGEARRRMNPSDASVTYQLDEMEVDTYDDLQTAETYHRNHVNLLKKLPLELLVEICKIAVDTSDVGVGLRGASHFAVVLGSVCQPLRALVHRTQPLWHRVTFTGKCFAQKSSFWLERLGGFPLYSVTLVWIDLRTIPQVVETLAITCPQLWKCLRLEGDDFNTPRLYNALQVFGLRLHSLALILPLNNKPPEASITVNPLLLVAVMCPVLESQESGSYVRSISLYVGTLDINFVALPFITHLELRMNHLTLYRYNTLHHILYATPMLRSLIIRPHGLMLTHPVQALPEIPGLECEVAWGHQHLEVLRIHTIGPVRTKYVFLFPRLQIVDMQCLHIWAAVDLFDSLLEFTPAGRAPIREIRVSMITVHPPHLKLALETFTDTLESLEISYCDGLDDDIFESLSRPITSIEGSLLCPRLRDINFSGTRDLKAGPLMRLIKARLPGSNFSLHPPTPIRNLTINDCININTEALPWMRANVSGVLCCVSKARREAS